MKETKKWIADGNKLIAEFMGFIPTKCNNGMAWNARDDVDNRTFQIHGRLITSECAYLKFHSSWEWLMPVIIKIINDNSSTFELTGKDFYPEIRCHLLSDQKNTIQSINDSHLNAVYGAVIIHIKQYNKKIYYELRKSNEVE